MRTFVALALVSAVVASACGDVRVSTAVNDVKDKHNVDLKDPAQVAQVAGGADPVGNKDAEAGLEMAPFRRAAHEETGDDLMEAKRYDRARAQYEDALKWHEKVPYTTNVGPIPVTKLRNVDDKFVQARMQKRAELNVKVARALTAEAELFETRARDLPVPRNEGHWAEARRLYRKAAQHYDAAAGSEQNATRRTQWGVLADGYRGRGK